MSLMSRGRVASWSREQFDNLTTPELRALMANAERLKEPEIAAMCSEILDARPRGHAPAPREKRTGPRALLSRNKAFEQHGIVPKSRITSRGGVKADGTVVVVMRADGVQKVEGVQSYLLWAPNAEGSRPWSDTPGGQERLEHCRIALERGAAEGLLTYGKRTAGAPPKDDGIGSERVDPNNVLTLRVEQRGDEYWGTVVK